MKNTRKVSNLHILKGSILLILILGIIIVVALIAGSISKEQQIKKSSYLWEQYHSGMKYIETEAEDCEVDSDCILFPWDCDICRFEAVSKKSLAEYQTLKSTYCKARGRNVSLCNSDSTEKAKCSTNKRCIIKRTL